MLLFPAVNVAFQLHQPKPQVENCALWTQIGSGFSISRKLKVYFHSWNALFTPPYHRDRPCTPQVCILLGEGTLRNLAVAGLLIITGKGLAPFHLHFCCYRTGVMGLSFPERERIWKHGNKKCKITFLMCVGKILLVVEALLDTSDIPGNVARPEKMTPKNLHCALCLHEGHPSWLSLHNCVYMSSASELNLTKLTKRLEKKKLIKCNMGSSSRHMLSATSVDKLIMNYLE